MTTTHPDDPTMRALLWVEPHRMIMTDQVVPTPGRGEALVRVGYSGICGSELSGFLGQSSLRRPPLVFGHEVAGHVVELGPHTTLPGSLAVGSRVAVNPLVSCGHCRFCVTGRQQLCPGRLLLGASLPGSNAEFVRVPVSALLPLPDSLELADAAMVEPAACAIRAVRHSGISPTDSALVVGAGAIGLFLLQVLGEWGVRRRFVAERHPDRRRLAADLGAIPLDAPDTGLPEQVAAATGGTGVDVAFDAVGSEQTRQDCLSGTAVGGTVVLVGLHTDATLLPLNTVVRSEITLRGTFAYSVNDFRDGLDQIATGRLGLRDGVVTAPLDDGQHWFERLVAGDPVAKVLLQPAGR